MLFSSPVANVVGQTAEYVVTIHVHVHITDRFEYVSQQLCQPASVCEDHSKT